MFLGNGAHYTLIFNRGSDMSSELYSNMHICYEHFTTKTLDELSGHFTQLKELSLNLINLRHN